jgi:hypothetical protein
MIILKIFIIDYYIQEELNSKKPEKKIKSLLKVKEDSNNCIDRMVLISKKHSLRYLLMAF